MQQRALGSSNLRVAPLCLGGNVFGWTATEGASFEVLDAFVSAGLNFIDTADVYSRWAAGHRGGESVTVIGNWLKRGAKTGRLIPFSFLRRTAITTRGAPATTNSWLPHLFQT